METSLRKVAGLGPRNPKIANAAVLALARIEQRGRARRARPARHPGDVQGHRSSSLDAALETRAAALGLTRDEIEELAVPAYGLTEVGARAEFRLGEATAQLEVRGTGP